MIKFEKKDIYRLLIIVLASVLSAFSINTFINNGGLYPGGFSGITILIQRSARAFFGIELPFSVINLILNSFPIYIGFRYIGKKFTLFSCIYTVLSSIFVDIIPGVHVTDDMILICIFGAILNACASAACLRENASSGGTDFIAMYLSQKKGIDSWNIIFMCNVGILFVAGVLFGFEKAMYSIIYQYASTQVLQTLYKKFQKITLFIVTNKPDDVCSTIFDMSNHGATIIDALGGYEGNTRKMVYSVISQGESAQVTNAIRSVDPDAFINEVKTAQLAGNFWMRRED